MKTDSLTVSEVGNSNALWLVVTNIGTRCGVVIGGSSGFGIDASEWYDLTFRARTTKRENDRGYGLTFSFESWDGREVCARTTLPEVGGEWREYTVASHSRLANPKAVLTITMSEPGAIWFDAVSVRQRQTSCGARTP